MSALVVAATQGGVVEAVGFGDRNTYTVAAGQTVTGGKMAELVTPGSMLVQLAGANSVRAVGVAIYNQTAGNTVTIAHHGIWYLTASGAITSGQRLLCAAAGAVIAAGAAPDARMVVAVAQEDAADTTSFKAKLIAT